MSTRSGSVDKRTSLLLGLAVSLPGCFSITEFGDDASSGESSPTSSTTTGILPSADASSGEDPTSSNSTGGALGTSADETNGNPSGCGGFICDPDGGPHEPEECSITEQDCPRGEKCNAWANDGSSQWNASKCFPIDPQPDGVGEPCTVKGSGVSGIDSCDLGSICRVADTQADEGVCIPYCVGTPDDLSCEDPARLCTVSSNGLMALCRLGCDPLDVGSCGDGQSCGRIGTAFGCLPDASGNAGAAFETCEFLNACNPGLVCAEGSTVGACAPEASLCCTPYCDLSAPMCPEPTTCLPYFADGQATPGHEDLGLCGTQPAP
ncbi:MAG: hypothetical protein ACRBN8_16400 [Nannocystales bacterium]